MKYDVTQLSKRDFQEAIDLSNMAFSMNGETEIIEN